MSILNDAYEYISVKNNLNKMEKDNHEQIMRTELYKRMRMYDDIHTIRNWVIFFGVITILAIVVSLFS